MRYKSRDFFDKELLILKVNQFHYTIFFTEVYLYPNNNLISKSFYSKTISFFSISGKHLSLSHQHYFPFKKLYSDTG